METITSTVIEMALIEMFCSYPVNKMEKFFSHHCSHSLLHYSVTLNISRQICKSVNNLLDLKQQ